MIDERFRHLPVVSGGVLMGILSDRDILKRGRLEGDTLKIPEMTVAEAATPSVHVCSPDTDVRHLVHVMTNHKIDAIPVVDGQRDLVGLVTSTDLLQLLLRMDEAKLPLPFQFELEHHSATIRA